MSPRCRRNGSRCGVGTLARSLRRTRSTPRTHLRWVPPLCAPPCLWTFSSSLGENEFLSGLLGAAGSGRNARTSTASARRRYRSPLATHQPVSRSPLGRVVRQRVPYVCCRSASLLDGSTASCFQFARVRQRGDIRGRHVKNVPLPGVRAVSPPEADKPTGKETRPAAATPIVLGAAASWWAGVGITTKSPVEAAVPADVVSAIGPVVALPGTGTGIVVAFGTVNPPETRPGRDRW